MEDTKTPLIDEIYKKLYRAQERDYPRSHNPKYQIYISHQQYDQLKREALNTHVFTMNPSEQFLFGERLIVVDETPYVRLVE
jgi:hypothetical protein